MSQGDSSEQRDRALEVGAWVADFREGMFTPARTADGWSVEMHGLADSAEKLAEDVLALEAEVVGLREQLAAAPDWSEVRIAERNTEEAIERAEVAVGRLEKAQAALREIASLRSASPTVRRYALDAVRRIDEETK